MACRAHYTYNTKNMDIAITILVVLLLLMGNEYWWRRHEVHNEFSRKFIHITVGSMVAAWPFYLSWPEIRVLSLTFIVVVILSKYLHVFRAIHSVQRPTWGEIYFAIAVGVVSFITQDSWIYFAAVLQMSLADGFAAIAGVRYGKQSYLVFGHRKSIVGSFAFFVTSLVILLGYAAAVTIDRSPLFFTGIAALATIAENVGVKGLDNLIVPVLVAVLLVGA